MVQFSYNNNFTFVYKWLLVACLVHVIQFSKAQTGYIYVHAQAVNEDTVPSTGFLFSLSGGPTSIPSFTLNDRPDLANAASTDLGAGHGTGDGELWSITGNILYHHLSDSSKWLSTQTITGTAVSRVDGALANQAVYISASKVYFYNGATNTTTVIFNPTSHASINAVDVAYANGIIVITGSDGSVLKNAGTTYPYADSWTTILPSTTAAVKIDISPVTNNIAFTVGTTSIDTATNTGTGLTVISANAADVAFADDGSLFSVIGGAVNKRTATSWVADNSCPTNVKTITGGPGGQLWLITYLSSNNTIFTRSTDGSGTVHWIDDERVRLTYNNNSIMVPVAPGNYTLTETKPASWDILGEIIYDPTNNSTANPSTNSAVINVSAGEVVHVIMQNERLVPVSLLKQCAANQVVENFGSAPSTAAYVAPAPIGITAYHYYNNQRFDDGYYSVANNSTNWPNATLIDHTTGTSNGCFMLVNASFQQDEFYRKRVTNLIPGIVYKINFYAASLSAGNNSIVTVNVNDSNTVLLATYTIPGFQGASYYSWKGYSFNFTATTAQADISLKNAGIGGGGNDLALDDISITPLSTVIQTYNTVSTSVCSGTFSTLSVSPAGGLYTSSNSSVASVNSSSGLITANSAGIASINYTLTNAIGCITDTSLIITVNPAPIVTASSGSNTVCRGQNINLNSTASGGTPPYTSYSWTTVTGNITGANNTSATTALQSTAGTYNYVIKITDGNGCSGTDTAVVAVTSSQAPVVSVIPTPTSLCGLGQTVSLSSTTSGTGPFTYTWASSAPQGGLNSPVNQSSASATPTASGSYTYSLTVTGANSCIATAASPVINASPGLSVSVTNSNSKLCNGQSLTLSSTPSGGVAPFTYAWTGSPAGSAITGAVNIQNITAKPTVAGTYTYAVTVTDASNCTATASDPVAVTLSSTTPPTVTLSLSATAACSGQTTLTLSAARSTTTGPYSYTWTGSGLTSTSTAATTTTPVTNTAVPSAGGTYSVTVKDANSCSATATSSTVTVNPLPVVAPVASYLSSTLCLGQNIALTANPSGGTGAVTAWTYGWTQTTGGGVVTTNTQNTTASPSVSGTYTYNVTATDTKGCVSSASTSPATITVSASTAPTLTAAASVTSACSGQTSVTLTANRTNTTLNSYRYVWSGSGLTTSSYTNNSTPTSTTALPVTNGVYTVIVTDGNNCSGTASTSSITVKPLPVIVATGSSQVLCLGGSLNLTSGSSGGTSPYSYLWTASPSANAGLGTATIQNTSAVPTATGSYIYGLKVTDNNSCYATVNVPLSVVSALSVTASVSPTSVCSANNVVTLVSTPSGGTAPYSYAWNGSTGSGLSSSTNNQQTSTAAPTADGSNYGVLIVDNNGCSASAFTATVSVLPSPSVTAAIITPSPPVCKGNKVSLSSTPSGGSGGYRSYLWSGSGIDGTNQNLQSPSNVTISASGNYAIQLTDNNGCTAVSSTPSTTVDIPVAMASIVCYSTYGELIETGGTAVSWAWTASNPQAVLRPDSTVRNPTTIYNGSYKVVIADAAGCKDSSTLIYAQGLCSILALDPLIFNGEKKDGYAVLSWQIEKEINVQSYVIERSINGINWEDIGSIKSNNQNIPVSYHFNDQVPATGINYYRIKLVMISGEETYSSVIKMVFADTWKLQLYPNPVNESSESWIKSNEALTEITVTDLSGRVIVHNQIVVPQTFNLKLPVAQYAHGTYFVKAKNGKGLIKILKIIR